MTHSAIVAKMSKEGKDEVAVPDETEFTITKGELRVLLKGLCVWNCPAVDMLTKEGQVTLHKAQDLAEKLWMEVG